MVIRRKNYYFVLTIRHPWESLILGPTDGILDVGDVSSMLGLELNHLGKETLRSRRLQLSLGTGFQC